MNALTPVASSRHTVEPYRSQSRLADVDFVRLLGLGLVVAGHVWSDSPFSGYVAIFFVITGYLWKDGRSLKVEAVHRFRTLIIPYVSWLVILATWFLVQSAVSGSSTARLAHQAAIILWGGERATRPFTAFWFLTAIFFATVVYRALTLAPLWLYLIGITTSVACAVYIGHWCAELPLGIGVGFCSMGFIAAGHALRKLEGRLNVLVGLFLVALSLTSIFTGWSDRMVLKSGDFGTPFVSMAVAIGISAGAILFAGAMRPYIPRIVGKLTTGAVSMSTPIILLHPVPLWILAGTPLPPLALFIIALSFPLMVGLVVRLSPQRRVGSLLMPGKFSRHAASSS